MSKSGNRINYSLRMQKNIERKIFGDIIRSLNYFHPISEYRYIGFGSFYFQDFMLFFDDFVISEGTSIEIEKTSYAKASDVSHVVVTYFKNMLWENERSAKIIETCCHDYVENRFNLDFSELDLISEMSRRIQSYFMSIVESIELFPDYTMTKKGIYDYSPDKIRKAVGDNILEFLQTFILKTIQVAVPNDDRHETSDNIPLNDFVARYPFNDLVKCDADYIVKQVSRLAVNRFNYNKPYGFINMNHNPDYLAIDKIEWGSGKKNIIWLDYDEFLAPTMLDTLEKSILKSSDGSLIIFSISMEQSAEIRLKKFEENFQINSDLEDYVEGDFGDEDYFDEIGENIEKSYRISQKITQKDCDTNQIHSTLYRIINDAIYAALSEKNLFLEDGEQEYKIQQVFNCTYSDGTPMFTYAFFIYSINHDEEDSYFPLNVLKPYPWLKTGTEAFKIQVPSLTHKEVNALNQFMPNTNAQEIQEQLPFIPLKDIKKYINIYRYYPQFFEVGYYV